MDKELFDQLHQSMKEAVAIAKDEIQPSRCYYRSAAGRKGTYGKKQDFHKPCLPP